MPGFARNAFVHWTISPGVPPWVTPPSDLLSPPPGLCVRRHVVSDSVTAIKHHLTVEKVERGTAGVHLLFPPPAPGAFCLGITWLTPGPPPPCQAPAAH